VSGGQYLFKSDPLHSPLCFNGSVDPFSRLFYKTQQEEAFSDGLFKQ
jgi:hypothetical protein